MTLQVFVLTETREGQPGEVRAFADAGAAYNAARSIIEDYAQNSRIEAEVSQVLEDLDTERAADPYRYGAGDASCFFYVEVARIDVE